MEEMYLGIDIGGSSVRMALYQDSTKELIIAAKRSFKRYGDVKKEIDENICKMIEDTFYKSDLDIKNLNGIGIALAANFNRQTGDIVTWPNNLTWNNYGFKRYLQSKYNVPIIMEDDANSAAIGEYVYGSAKGISNFIYITISTGIGAGLFLKDNLYTGEDGWAGELGHIKVEKKNKIPCSCGKFGCLQAVASGTAITRKLKEEAANHHVKLSHSLRLEDILKDKIIPSNIIKNIFMESANYLSNTITTLSILLDISTFVLGGGVILNNDYFFEALDKQIKEAASTKRIELKKSIIEENNGVVGALNLIYKFLNKKNMIIKEKYNL